MHEQGILKIQSMKDEDLSVLNPQELADYLAHYDAPCDYVKGRLRCLDLSLIPQGIRKLFGRDGVIKSV